MQTQNKPVVSDRANNVVTGRKPDRPQFASEFVSEHDTEIALEREYFIVQHNDMVQKQRFALGKNAGNSLTVTEEKVLAYLISKIKPESTSLEPVEMDIKTFCEVCGLGKGSTDNCYPQVKAAVDKLARRVMWLYDDATKSETTVRYIDRVQTTLVLYIVPIQQYISQVQPHPNKDRKLKYVIPLWLRYSQFDFEPFLSVLP